MSDTRQKLTLPQSRRMKSPAEFERCYARKRSASDANLILYVCENSLAHPRLGCSVSKKLGGAVLRNRWKRLLREAFRLEQHNLPPGLDLVIIPRPAVDPSLDAVRQSLVKLAQQAAGKLRAGAQPHPLPPPPPGEREIKCPSHLGGGVEEGS